MKKTLYVVPLSVLLIGLGVAISGSLLPVRDYAHVLSAHVLGVRDSRYISVDHDLGITSLDMHAAVEECTFNLNTVSQKQPVTSKKKGNLKK